MRYSDAGVDVDIEEKAAKILYQAAKATWNNRKGLLGEVILPFDDFSGIRAIDVGSLPKGTLMNIGFDGVGSKSEIAELTGKYDTLAYDLIAMVCDDAVIRGGESVLVGSILDVNSLGKSEARLQIIHQLARGYVKAAKRANVAIINGEIAQLGNRVGGKKQFALGWGAAVVWFTNRDKLITGHKVKPGDLIIGLEETSLRSNGISLVRKVLSTKLGETWYKKSLEGSLLGDLAIEPSTIFSPALVEMFGGWDKQRAVVDIHAAANITGGGLPSKLGRALKPTGFGATVDHPFDPSKLMLYCQKIGNVSDREAYRTWHMGQGMVIIAPEPEKVINIAVKHHIKARIIGMVTEESGIRIRNRGAIQEDEWLTF